MYTKCLKRHLPQLPSYRQYEKITKVGCFSKIRCVRINKAQQDLIINFVVLCVLTNTNNKISELCSPVSDFHCRNIECVAI